MTPENNQLQRVQGNTPAFLLDAMSSLEKMQAYATLLADSELLPKHFYRLNEYKQPIKGTDNKMIPNIPAVILTIQHGMEVGMSISQALQQVVPINGVTSIKGDGAMALIQNSGLCLSWKEETSGSLEKEDYTVKITAKHRNGREKVVEFSVYDAKRLGLWITPEMVTKNDKLKHGGWWKVPKRMIAYRALGFMARDLFPEVMQGMYTEEEARDFTEDNTVMVTSDGITARLDESKPEKLNSDAKEALSSPTTSAKSPSKKAADDKKKEDIKKEPEFTEAEVVEETKEDVPAGGMKIYTKKELDELATKDVLQIVNTILTEEGAAALFAKNKDKRVVGWLKKIVLSSQDGTLESLIEKEFGMKLADLSSVVSEKVSELSTDKSDSVIEKTTTDDTFGVSEPGDNGRGFSDLLALDQKKSDLGLTNDSIMTFINENDLGFVSVEQFYRHAPSETILVAFGI